MLPERFQRQVDRINRFPINQHARKLLHEEGVYPAKDEIHCLHLFRVCAEDGRVELERRRHADTEQSVFELLEMRTWNPMKAAGLLRLRSIKEKPTAEELVEEIAERIDGLEMEKKI